MSDNTTLPPGAGGDTIRTLDRTGTGSPKTEVVQLDVGPWSRTRRSYSSLESSLADDSLPVALASDVVSLFARG